MTVAATSGSVYQLLAGVSGAFVVVIVALGIALSRTSERVAKLEQSVDELMHEKRNRVP